MKNNKLLACPYIVWMILFTIIPLGIVFYYALTDSITGQFTPVSYTHLRAHET